MLTLPLSARARAPSHRARTRRWRGQGADKEVFDALRVRIAAEQAAYHAYAHRLALADRARYDFVRPTVARLVDVRRRTRPRHGRATRAW